MDFHDFLNNDVFELEDADFDPTGAISFNQLPKDIPPASDPDSSNLMFGLSSSELQAIKEQHDAVIFLIDCNQSMFI